MKKIVVLGAGYGGVLTAKKLAKKLKKTQDVSITVIDKNPYHTMLTQLHEVAAGRVSEDLITMDLKQIFAHRPVNVILDTITNFDFENKVLIGDQAHYEYDYLVIGAGSKSAFFRIKGAKEYSFPLWSYDDAIRLRNHIEGQFQKAASEQDSRARDRMLSFYVIGAGPTGIQMTGELAEYIPILCKKYRIDRDAIRLVNLDVLERVLPSLSQEVSRKVQTKLESQGVEFKFRSSVMEIEQSHIVLQEEGYSESAYPTETVIWTAGIKGSEITQIAGEHLGIKGRGRLETNQYLQSVKDNSVFVVGDNLFYIPEGDLLPVPQMVENCKHSAEVVSENLATLVKEKGDLIPYRPKFRGSITSVGSRSAAAQLYISDRLIRVPFCIAMLLKHIANMIYLMKVMGWVKVFDYLKKEFFTIRNRRSVFGGHFSNVTPSFMLLPIRIWLGLTWIFKGMKKISENWWSKPQLEAIFEHVDWWYQSIINPSILDTMSSATHTIDARTSATILDVDGIGEVFWNWNFWGLIKGYLVSDESLIHSTLADIALKIDIPALNNLFSDYIFGNQGAVLSIQRLLVILEIAIGICLILGMLNFFASALSLLLQSVFLITTGLYLDKMWMTFAAWGILFGGGQTFGVDYYLLPVCKEWWKKKSFVKKWYLYHD